MRLADSFRSLVFVSAVFGAAAFGQTSSPSVPSSSPGPVAPLPPLSNQYAPGVLMQWLAAPSVFITSQLVTNEPFRAEVDGRQTMTMPDGR
jgi:hypothetical protein